MSTLENFTVFECPGIQAEFENLPDPYLFSETQIIRSGESKPNDGILHFGSKQTDAGWQRQVITVFCCCLWYVRVKQEPTDNFGLDGTRGTLSSLERFDPHILAL